MKKGLIITFVIVAAMFSSGVFAYAPVIQSIPDIVIGNAEDTATDPNFFRYSNAFAFDNVVTDTDSPVSTLKWCFVVDDDSSPTNHGAITINALGPETADPTYINPTNDLRAADAVAEFRDILASPVGGAYQGTDLSDLHIALYASDGEKVSDPKVIRVHSAVGSDGNTGINAFFTDSFATNDTTAAAYWRPYGVTGTVDETMGHYDSVNGRLVINCPTTIPAGNWWQWLQKYDTGFAKLDLVYAADSTYVLKTNISASRDTQVPQIRLRIGANDFAWTATHTIGAIATTVPQDFFTIFEPQGSTADAFLAVDWYSAAQTSAMEIYINSMSIYRFPKAQVVATGFSNTITDMNTFANIGGTEAPVTITASTVTMPDVSSTWAGATQLYKLTEEPAVNDVYRISYSVSKTANTSECDPFRLRVNDVANPEYTSMMVITDGASPLITATATPVVVYQKMLNGRFVDLDSDLSLSFDCYNGGNGPAVSVLHSVLIEKVTLPALN